MKRHLVTAGLPYVNGVKHLGNLVGSLLPADVYSRFLRQEGHQVLFVCGTDEHGTPAELAAARSGRPVEAFTAELHATQADLYRRLGLSFDHFGRSSSPCCHETTQQVYALLGERGFLEDRETRRLYSPTDGRFLPDRYVEGRCPRCGNPSARGDQCDACGAVLDPLDLIEPRSAVSGATDLEVRTSRHAFLRLSALQDALQGWIASHEGDWDPLPLAEARGWLERGLHDRSITRDLTWGVPVPGRPGKVFYVWFDAPLAYVGITCEWAATTGAPEAWRRWWSPERDDVEYTQFMGKDNLAFHTVLFPATLLGAGTPFRLVDRIKAMHWLDWYGQRFSTSRGQGLFLDRALDLLPADVWRYGLLARAPETADSTFTWEGFAATVDKDLVGVWGNFVNRVLRLTARYGATVPTAGLPGPAEEALEREVGEAVDRWRASLRDLRFREVIRALRELWSLGNRYVDREQPWALRDTDPDRLAVVLRTCFALVRLYATVSAPVLPHTSERVLRALGAEPVTGRLLHAGAVAGRPFEVPPPLFERLGPRLADLERAAPPP